MVIVLIVIVLVYCALPWQLALLIGLANLFIPDTIPIIDELFMVVVTLHKIKNAILLCEIVEKYWKIILIVGIAIIAGIIYLLLHGGSSLEDTALNTAKLLSVVG